MHDERNNATCSGRGADVTWRTRATLDAQALRRRLPGRKAHVQPPPAGSTGAEREL